MSQVGESVIGGEFVEGMIWFTIWKNPPRSYMETDCKRESKKTGEKADTIIQAIGGD